MQRQLLCALLALVGCSPVARHGANLADDSSPETSKVSTLAQSRHKLVLPELTLAEKELVVSQALTIMRDVYVHQDVKRERYGDDVWATPKLLRLQERLASVSTRELHETLASIIKSQRDLHLNYNLPKPHACFSAYIPTYFSKVQENDGSFTLRVSGLDSDDYLPAEIQPLVHGISVGDKLLTYGGKTPFQALAALDPLSQGASVDPREKREIDLLSERSLSLHFAPDEDAVDLVLERPSGERYTVKLPWLLWSDEECLKPEASPEVSPSASDESRDTRKKHAASPESDRGAVVPWESTTEPTLRWKIMEQDGKRFGRIHLKSFSPQKLSVEETVDEVRSLLHKMEDTDGLVFDVRGNGGGKINLAERLLPLFSPAVPELHSFRALNTETVRTLFKVNDWSPWWATFFDTTPRDARYVNGPGFTNVRRLERTSQEYFGPVTVLVDGNCYSSCDMFAALMQDNRAARIWSLNGWQTGAGGANNTDNTDFISANSPLQALPYGQVIGFSIRQTLRTGKNKGRLLEDEGVRADRVHYFTLADLMDNGRDLWADIFQDLMVRQRELNGARARIENTEVSDKDMALPLSFKETDTLVIRNDEKGEQKIKLPATAAEAGRIVLDSSLFRARRADLTIQGFRKNKLAWRLTPSVRALPEILPLAANQTLSGGVGQGEGFQKWALFRETQGSWVTSGGALRTQAEDLNGHDLDQTASLFVHLPEGAPTALSLEANIDTELDCDFFWVEITTAAGTTRLMEPVSGALGARSLSFDLSAYAGQNVELRLRFTSDPAVNAAGVVLNSWKLGPLN